MMTLGSMQSNSKSYFSSIVWLQFLLSILLLVIGIFCAFAVQRMTYFSDLEGVQLLPYMVIGYICHDFFRKLFYSQKDEKFAFILDISVYGLQLLSLAFFSYLDTLTMSTAILSVSSSYLLGTVLLFSLKLKYSSISLLPKSLKTHWSFSKWLVAKSGLQWLSGNLFLIAAGSLLGAIALGAVRMAQNVIGVLNIVFLTIENTVPVKAADILILEGKKDLNIFFKELSKNTGLLVLILLLLICVFSKPILYLIYGEVTPETVWVLRGFCILYLIVFLSTIKRLHITTLEANQQIFMAYLISAGFSIIAAYPMISSLGLTGVVLGFILTQLISLVYYSIYLNKNHISL